MRFLSFAVVFVSLPPSVLGSSIFFGVLCTGLFFRLYNGAAQFSFAFLLPVALSLAALAAMLAENRGDVVSVASVGNAVRESNVVGPASCSCKGTLNGSRLFA